jgi:hypothetical protein
MKYSIWAMPPEPLFTQLKDCIDSLAKENNAPTFEPHMTMVGTIDQDLTVIEQTLQNCLASMTPMQLELGEVSFSTTYFQSVLVRVSATAQLMELNMQIKNSLNLENDVFMPHFSLLYGNHSMKERAEIAARIKLPTLSFEIDTLVITPAVANPDDWEHLSSYKITSGK